MTTNRHTTMGPRLADDHIVTRRAPRSLSPGTHRIVPRTVPTCELYLDRLALVVERAKGNYAAFLPLVTRLQRELAEAKAEQQSLEDMRRRATERAKSRQP